MRMGHGLTTWVLFLITRLLKNCVRDIRMDAVRYRNFGQSSVSAGVVKAKLRPVNHGQQYQ